MDLDLRHLRHARALAEHRHFGRAARALRLTQPALSRSIAELERQAGVRLFDRGAGGVEPTDMGRLLLDRAAELLARAEDLGREMESLQGRGAGTLRVGAGTYPAGIVVGDAVAALVRLRPDVQIQVVVESVFNLLPLLRRRELDLVIGDAAAVAGDAEFQVTSLAPRQGYFICRAGHPLLALAAPEIADVLAWPVVSSARNVARRLAPAVAATRQAGRPVAAAPTVTCESLDMMKAIAAGSDGVALLPLNVVARELEEGTLAALPLVEPSVQADFGLIRLANRTPPPSVEDFARLLLEADARASRLSEEIGQKLLGRRVPARKVARATARRAR